jgi:hypothetical protein
MRVEQSEVTFEQQAEQEIDAALQLSPAEINEDQAHWYAALFIMDYTIALNSPNTTAEHFMAAYANRALAIRHCRPGEMRAQREALDMEAYRLRLEWRAGRGV